MTKKACVIGSGFAGLSAACHLAQKGYRVEVLEKNKTPGGRARSFAQDGFRFDMGPSWYWMPDVFERFFACFNKKTSDYYELIRLDPSYTVKFEDGPVSIPATLSAYEEMCEAIEPGSSPMLRKFLHQAAYKYQVGIRDLVYKPGSSVMEFMDSRLLLGLLKMDVFTSMRRHVGKYFKSEKLRKIMEFPVLFLGATPSNIPALYSLMNYADIALGTWYPQGGMFKIVEAMVGLAEELGVTFHFEREVQGFSYRHNRIRTVVCDNAAFDADVVVAGADYHHVDQHILHPDYRMYSEKYWSQRVMAPSCLIYYLGLNMKLPKMDHHVLFFDEDFDRHAREIYEKPTWPSRPLLYTSVTSKTDASAAPDGKENLFVLIPAAPDLEDNEETRERYFELSMDKIEEHNNLPVRDHIAFKRSYAHRDFKSDYHSFKGNAYGLANTLRQTAILKPRLKHKKLKNLYYTGQLTVPGPGVPPSLISGEVAAREAAKDFG